MIRINNLTKIYKSKRRSRCKALDNINLTLPNKGLVFVLGKSGSGKSTLLNLIGGLDNITKGSIIVDGNNISYFNEKEFCDYRNTHIGFIFQDYHLIDELTVYENIVLSLNLRKIEDRGLVRNALKRVDLAGYEDRYPGELSGGERQRVAIARAIVKKPRIILADEPTGNLDNVTSTAIIKLLKALSNECLILIVSHNTNDAYNYADRIIELSKGKIIRDNSKNIMYPESVVYNQNTLFYPKDTSLNDNDINVINYNLSNNNIKQVVKLDNKYTPTLSQVIRKEKVEIVHKNLSFYNEMILTFKFLKNKIVKIFTSSFMVSAIMIILALSQTIISFDANKVLTEELKGLGLNSVYVEKHVNDDEREALGQYYYYEVNDEDKEKLKNNGVDMDLVYPVYSYTLPITLNHQYSGFSYNNFTSKLFLSETRGTMIVDEEFFIEKIGYLEYLALSDDIRNSGVYITDFVADSILLLNHAYNGLTYEDIIGEYSIYSTNGKRGYINGIIKTDYKEKHGDFLNEVISSKNTSISKYYHDQDFVSLVNDIYDYLGFTFSLNKNFVEDIKNNPDNTITWHHKFYINDIEVNSPAYGFVSYDENNVYKLKENEVVMSFTIYNDIFNTNYTSSTVSLFKPHKISVKQYRTTDYERENMLLSFEVTIKRIVGTSATFFCEKTLYDKIHRNSIYEKGFYYNSNENVNLITEFCKDDKFHLKSYIIEGVETMVKAVNIFVPIFELIAIILCVGIVFILVSFSMRMIQDKLHDIGILKALGTQNKTIVIIFGLQIFLIAILTIIMSTIGYYYFVGIANDVLVASLKEFATTRVVLEFNFLVFKHSIVYMDIILILTLSILSLFIPMLKIRKIKPVKIIKTKE